MTTTPTIDRRHARPGARELGRVGERPRHRLPHPEPAARRASVRGRRASASAGRRAPSATACSTSRAARGRRAAARACRPTRSRRLPGADAQRAHGPDAAGAARRRCARRARRPAARRRARPTPGAAARASCRRRTSRCCVPAAIGDYTDFYASVFHATNVGQHVPARQPAAAELQVRADRLPRPRLVDRRRAARRCGGRTGRRSADGAARPSSARRRASTTSSRSALFVGPGQPARRADPDRRGRGAHRSASAW